MLEKTILLNRLVSLYGGLLTDKQRDAIELYYNCDMSLAEIADELAISRQGVRDTLTRAEHTLTEAEHKLGFMQRLSDISAKLKIIACSEGNKDKLCALIKELEE